MNVAELEFPVLRRREDWESGTLPEAIRRSQDEGRSARVVVTMGMPALLYRWYFGSHSLKSLERNILKFCGIAPVRDTVVRLVESGARRTIGRPRA